jgi:uncharacterized membrane protein
MSDSLNNFAASSGVVIRPVLPVLSLIGLIFVTAKVFGFISWPWWLVLLPFYGLWALVFGIGLLILAGGAIFAAFVWIVVSVAEALRKRRIRKANKATSAR